MRGRSRCRRCSRRSEARSAGGRARAAVPGRRCSSAGRSPRSEWSGSPSRSSLRTIGRSSRRSRRTRCVPSRRRSSARSRSRSWSSPPVLRGEAGARGRSRSRCSAARRCCIVFHGFNLGAVATTLVAVVLVAQRHEFDAPGDPATRPALALRAVLLAAGIFAYGALALWLNQLAIDQPVSLGLISRETGAALLGARFHGSTHLGQGIGDWFPLSVFVAGLAGATWLLLGWIGPWRYRLRQEARERRARARPGRCLGRRHARALRAPRRQVVLLLDRRARLPRLPGRGRGCDRLGRPGRAAGRRTACCSTSSPPSPESGAGGSRSSAPRSAASSSTGRRGLHALYHGDEAVVETGVVLARGPADPEGAPVGPPARARRLPRRGAAAAGDRPAPARRARGDRARVARRRAGAWLRDGARRALPARRRGRRSSSSAGRRPARRRASSTSRSVRPAARCRSPRCRGCAGRRTGSTSGSSARPSTGRERTGIARVSLNFAPFAALLAPEAELSRLQRLERRRAARLKGHFQLDNLLLFNRKFFPSWERRFVVYERRRRPAARRHRRSRGRGVPPLHRP